MKHLRETFTDQEFEVLKQTKGIRSWHDFLLIKCVNYSGIVVDAYCPKCKSIVTFDVDKLVNQEVKTE